MTFLNLNFVKIRNAVVLITIALLLLCVLSRGRIYFSIVDRFNKFYVVISTERHFLSLETECRGGV